MALYAVWFILALCLVLVPSRIGRRAAAPAIAFVLLVLLGFHLADLAVEAAYGRAFNPFVDGHLAEAGARLLAGMLGLPLLSLIHI